MAESKTNKDNYIFYQIYSMLYEIGDKLDYLVLAHKPAAEDDVAPDILSTLQLPEYLQQTVFALYELGEATAEEISNITKKKRAVESAYLNYLVKHGYIQKKRVGRMIYFTIE